MYKLLSPLLSPYSLITRVFACGLLLSFVSLSNANTAEKIPDFNFTIPAFNFTIVINTTAAKTMHHKNYIDVLPGNRVRTNQFLPDKLIQ